MEALGAFGLLLLVANVVAHLVLCVSVGRKDWVRGIAGLVLPPAAAVWGWRLGARRAVAAWVGTLVGFTLIVVAIRFVR